MDIRPATKFDLPAIHRVYWSAFSEEEREPVAKLAVDLLDEDTAPPTISLVAEDEETVVGHAAFSPLWINNDAHFRGYLLAPLAVKPEFQKRRIGSKLVENGVQHLSELGVEIIIVYGDPAYYSRFGFTAEAAEGLAPPFELKYPFGWLAVTINESGDRKTSGKLICVDALNNPTLW